MRRGTFLPALLAAALTGCYTYAPIEPAAVPVGAPVRVHLTREGVLGLPDLGGREGPVLDGAVTSRAGDALSIRVPVVVRREGFLQNSLGQNVALPLTHIARVETRRLSRSRTGLVVLGTAGAAAFVVFAIMEESWFRAPAPPTGGDDLRGPLE